MDEENLGVSGIDGAGKCDSIPELGESCVIVGGEREEKASLEDKPVEVGGSMDGGRANLEVGIEPEFVGESLAEMVKMPAVVAEDGGDGVIGSAGGDPSFATEEDGSKGFDFSEREAVVGDGGTAPVSYKSIVNKEGDELVIDYELEMTTEEEMVPVVGARLEIDVTDYESKMDVLGDEIPEDPHLQMRSDKELFPVVNPMMDMVDTDAGYDQQLVELQTDAGVGEKYPVMEGTEACNDEYERGLGAEEKVEALGSGDSESVERMMENNAEIASTFDDKAEVKGEFMVNDPEVGSVEKSNGFEEEKSDHEIISDVPISEVETDGSMHLVNAREHDQVHESTHVMEDDSGPERNEYADDKAVAAEESQIQGIKMVEDENFSMKVSSDSNLDEEEYKEGLSVKEDLLAGDIKPEEESRVESEMTRNAEVEPLSEDAEEETEMGTNSVHSKSPDDDGKFETEDTMSDSPSALQDEEDETTVAEEEIGTQDTEMETEADMAESGKTSGGKRKRAKLSKSPPLTKATAKGSSRKTVGEDVCFICFDGGELVLCDRRGCPKAYHPSCVNRDEAFFRSKGRWNCGWHICSKCEKNARYMCYTCAFSLCKGCTKDAVIFCVRGNKGFCETCMRTVELIENNVQGDNDALIDFDDKSSWEYLFKDYYTDLKAKLSLSSVEIAEAKNPWKGADMSGTSKIESPEVQADGNDGGSGSDDSIENSDTIRPKRRKTRRQSKSLSKKEELVDTGVASRDKAISSSENSEWASRELLEFVSHMKNNDTSVLSQFDVQALLLEYIKRNKLRDPRRKSQIVCDSRLENLFGKPRVGHFEMLKLLESHFYTRDEQNDDFQGSVVDTENEQLDIDANAETPTKGVKDKKRKSRKKGDQGPQSNLDDLAAIDMHNIGLIYMRRKLMEDLLEDTETFNEKVVGTFVRIRISGNLQKQDLYRLVQVVGTSKAAEPYKVGKRTTDTMVEILNLNKTEIISIDTISNQEFTEDECNRLRQSIKCGLISRLTVGEILDKTMEMQEARVNDWLESETLRLSHLRDRASDLGRRKELRECVEKLQLLKTPEERRRRLEEIPEIHADPRMDPSYESDDKGNENEDTKRDAFMKSRGSGFSKRGRGPISPGRDNYVKDSWSCAGKATPSRNLSGNNFSGNSGHVGEIVNDSSWTLEKDNLTQESNILDRPNSARKSESAEWALRTVSRPESTSGVVPLPSQGSYSAGVAEPSVKINESEKIWHYQDPSGKMQGPFSIVQLRKWNNTGYFPANLKIWKATEKQENSVLLVDALAGKFLKEMPTDSMFPATNTSNSSHALAGHSGKTSGASLYQDNERSKLNQSNSSLPNLSADKWSRNDTMNLPSPTPKQSNTGWSGGEASHLTVSVQSPSVNGVLPSPTAVLPNVATYSSNPASVLNSVIQATSFSPTPNSQQGILVSSAVPLHTQTTSMSEHVAQLHGHPPAVVQPVQAAISQNIQVDTQIWGSGTQSGQSQGYGWGTSNIQSSSGSYPNSGPGTGIQPDVWRPTQSSQPNMHSPTTPNASWGMGPADNNTPMVVRPQNPNVGWGTMQANPNMGWGNPAPGNTNVNWGPGMQGLPSGNTPGWVPPPVNNNGGNMQGMVPGNTNPGWGPTQGWGAPPVQGQVPSIGWGPPSVNVGTNPAQGPGQGNGNQSWAPWGGEQGHGGVRFSGQRGGQGRDSGFSGGGRPFNRQSSFGGGSGGGPFGGGGGGVSKRKGETMCPYNANGQCRKGSRCDFLHT